MVKGSDALPQSSRLTTSRGGLNMMRPQAGGVFNRSGALPEDLWSHAGEVSEPVSARPRRPCTHLPWLQVFFQWTVGKNGDSTAKRNTPGWAGRVQKIGDGLIRN